MQCKRRPQCNKTTKKLKIGKIHMPEIQDALQKELSDRMEKLLFNKGETEENWSKLRDEDNTAAKETIGKMKTHHQDWFDANDS